MDISAVDLEREVSKIMNEYGFSVNSIVQEEVTEVSKLARKKIAAEARKNIGGRKYKSSFKNEGKKSAGGLFVEHIIWNKDYRLTHLLEKGHRVVSGGQVVGHASARPHFLPVQEWLEEELPKRITQRIKKIK